MTWVRAVIRWFFWTPVFTPFTLVVVVAAHVLLVDR